MTAAEGEHLGLPIIEVPIEILNMKEHSMQRPSQSEGLVLRPVEGTYDAVAERFTEHGMTIRRGLKGSSAGFGLKQIGQQLVTDGDAASSGQRLL